MAKTQSKCAHLPYVCVGEKYCTQFCKVAESEETEIASIAITPPAQNKELRGLDPELGDITWSR
jgi:hypothetical protein